MDDSMDIDIDLGDGIDYGQATEDNMGTEPVISTEQQQPVATNTDDIPDAYKDDFDADLPAKDRIHITGLDGVAEPVILQFVEEHVPDKKVKRLQWIDDSSANIIFYKNEDAAEALDRLSVVQDTAPAVDQLRPAKTFNARPDLQFQIRRALVSDKKKPGAKDRSAFYLFNPEYDPENRRYDRRYDRRDGRRGRGGRFQDKHDRPDSRRRMPAEKKTTFTEDMYDDAPNGQTADEGELMRRMSTTSLSSGDHARRRQSYEGVELFDHGRKSNHGRLRDRSRSPVRDSDGDGRYGFAEQPARQRTRVRSRSPFRERPTAKDRKELFPGQVPSSSLTPLSNGNSGLELFPDHSAKRSRELFPHKTQHSNHRRSDALNGAENDGIVVPAGPRSLADRVTGGPNGTGQGPRDNGFSVKGAGGFSVKGAGGFSVRGAAGEINPKVKELFPDKVASVGNSGKELFPAASGRGGPRRRAEDMLD